MNRRDRNRADRQNIHPSPAGEVTDFTMMKKV
jgi:hypothetical protein